MGKTMDLITLACTLLESSDCMLSMCTCGHEKPIGTLRCPSSPATVRVATLILPSNPRMDSRAWEVNYLGCQ